MNITAVLITKEKEYPKEVLDSLKSHFDEILIETECKSVHRRYELALTAKHPMIYVQDDDCIVDVIKLISHYRWTPDGKGERLTNAITPHHYEYYKGTGITLVGWGTFFPKKMVDFGPYLRKYGTDPLFYSQTDRIFTYLNQPFDSVVMDIKHLSTAAGPGRMSTSPDHWDNLAKIKERLYNLTI